MYKQVIKASALNSRFLNTINFNSILYNLNIIFWWPFIPFFGNFFLLLGAMNHIMNAHILSYK